MEMWNVIRRFVLGETIELLALSFIFLLLINAQNVKFLSAPLSNYLIISFLTFATFFIFPH